MGIVRSMYRAARLANDVSALGSGSPRRVGNRAKNKVAGRALARSGVWCRLWGRWL